MMNIQGLMKQAQMMQKKMQEEQEKIEQQEFIGTSGWGIVKIIINGKFSILKINIDKSILAPEESEVLEDLIIAAYSDAKTKAEAKMGETMNSITGGLNLNGIKLPF